MKVIRLPLPPTDNNLFKPARGRLIQSSVYRKWIAAAEIDWRLWKRSNPDFKPFSPAQNEQMEFQFHLFLPSWRSDLGNYNKALADFLGGNKKTSRLYSDDHYIFLRLILPVVVDKADPRVEVCPYPEIYKS